MTGGGAELRLGLVATADNLALVRQALAGLADGAGIEPPTLADLKQIATEACMNAVVHAYPNGEPGRMDVVATAAGGVVELRVRDWGVGFHPRPADGESLRLGLPLIASMADSFEIATPPDGGTVMTARLRIGGSPNGGAHEAPRTPRQAEMAVTAGESARPVIARVLAIAATRAGFSLDRMSDGLLIGDAIAAGDPGDFTEALVGIEIEECGPDLCIRVGPFVRGGADRTLRRMELPGMGVSLTKLANRIEVVTADAGEYLEIDIGGDA